MDHQPLLQVVQVFPNPEKNAQEKVEKDQNRDHDLDHLMIANQD